MTRLPILAVSLLFLLLPAGGAQAEVCDEPSSLPMGPVTAGLLDGDLGLGLPACGRSQVAMAGGGMLLADTFNFYGNLSAGLTLEGSYARGRGQLLGGWEFLRYESVIAPLPSSFLGLGHLRLGGGYRLVEKENLAFSLHGQAVLPTTSGLYQNAFPIGFDLGLSAQIRAHEHIHVHGDVGLLGSVAVTSGDPQPRLGAAVTAGVELRPSRRFALVVDLYGNFGYGGEPLEVFAAALALRFADDKRFGMEMGATIPLAGRDQTALSFEMRAQVLLGKRAVTSSASAPSSP